MLPEVRIVIEKGNMTDAEYIAALIAENQAARSNMKKLERENLVLKESKRRLEKDKLEIEIECLKKDNHIYLEALILSKHRHTEAEGQQSFFNEAEAEYAEKTVEPISKTVKGYTRKSPKT